MALDIVTIGLACSDVLLKPMVRELFDRDAITLDSIMSHSGGDAVNTAIDCQKMGLDIQAVALVYFASWTLTSIVFVIYYLRGNWLNRRISVMGYAPEVKKAKT